MDVKELKELIVEAFKKSEPVHCDLCGKLIPSLEADEIYYIYTKRQSHLFLHKKCADKRGCC